MWGDLDPLDEWRADIAEAIETIEAQAHKLQIADERSTSDARVINTQRGIIYARDNTIKTQAREIEALRADAERWRALLARAMPMLEEHKDYADSAPVWHCTGYEANTLSVLIPEIRAAIEAGKAVTP
jgi:hypothetical protein